MASHCPIKVSFFIWKLMKKALPTYTAIQKKGITLCSKCVCCPTSPSIEYATHLFLLSETAMAIWEYYDLIMEVDSHDITIGNSLNKWWINSGGSSVLAWLLRILPFMIL